jgi:hypothetical protein
MRSNRRSLCHFGIVLFAVLFSSGGARAQTASPTPTPTPALSRSLEQDFFKNILRDRRPFGRRHCTCIRETPGTLCRSDWGRRR